MDRSRIAALVSGAAITLIASTACSDAIAGEAAPAGDGPAAVAATTTTTDTPDPLDLDDFVATLKVTEKQCYGYGLGCDMTAEPTLEYVHDLETLENRTYSVTLTIAGDQSGPMITTVDATGTQYDVMPVFLTTAGPRVTPTAKVTDVEEY
jgi:hypothetical protein